MRLAVIIYGYGLQTYNYGSLFYYQCDLYVFELVVLRGSSGDLHDVASCVGRSVYPHKVDDGRSVISVLPIRLYRIEIARNYSDHAEFVTGGIFGAVHFDEPVVDAVLRDVQRSRAFGDGKRGRRIADVVILALLAVIHADNFGNAYFVRLLAHLAHRS